jgi:hypothetical protein
MSDDPFAFPDIINSRELGPGHGKGFGFMKVYVVGSERGRKMSHQ